MNTLYYSLLVEEEHYENVLDYLDKSGAIFSHTNKIESFYDVNYKVKGGEPGDFYVYLHNMLVTGYILAYSESARPLSHSGEK